MSGKQITLSRFEEFRFDRNFGLTYFFSEDGIFVFSAFSKRSAFLISALLIGAMIGVFPVLYLLAYYLHVTFYFIIVAQSVTIVTCVAAYVMVIVLKKRRVFTNREGIALEDAKQRGVCYKRIDWPEVKGAVLKKRSVCIMWGRSRMFAHNEFCLKFDAPLYEPLESFLRGKLGNERMLTQG